MPLPCGLILASGTPDYYCNFCIPNNTGLKIFEQAFRSDFWQL
jgi:hypothetical protein